ncbi:hypothetical protein GCM10027425_12550 [Alteromonas gracilis]
MSTPEVHIKKIVGPGWRWRPSRGVREWQDPYAHAVVDGFTVTVSPRHGWRCNCPNVECGHVDAFADLIHPHTLALLEGERIISKKEKNA